MKTAVCCIVKCENLYLREWVEYYKQKGFTKIFLYDNNNVDGEYPQQVIGDYIADGFVEYIDARGKYRYQLAAYDECYDSYSNEYDWIGFFDIDEYIVIEEYNNISDYLSRVPANTDVIYLSWMIYGDNGRLHYENKPIQERFTTPKGVLEKNCFKLLIKGKNSGFLSIQFHDANYIEWYCGKPIVYRNAIGEDKTYTNLYEEGCFRGVYLKHYNTLTIEEFLYRRFGRGSYADKDSSFNVDTIMNIFYSINEITEEKKKIIDEFFERYKIKEDNVGRI